mgnify:CR=1 FL=1
MEKKDINLNEAPEFLRNGIMLNGKVYYPLTFEMTNQMIYAREFVLNQRIGNELLKIIKKRITEEEQLYMKNKLNIVNSKILLRYYTPLHMLDFQELINYLNTLKLSKQEKLALRPSVNVIKEYIKNVEYLNLAMKLTRLKYTL